MMIRILSIGLAALLLTTPAFVAPTTPDEIKAPRVEDEIQAPVRDTDLQAPRIQGGAIWTALHDDGSEDQAPVRQDEAQAPRSA